MIPDNTISSIDSLVSSLSLEDCKKIFANNESIWRYRYTDERIGQYYFNMIFHGVTVSFPELFYEEGKEMAEEIYSNFLFKVIYKIEH